MKAILFAAALIAGPALAQDAPPPASAAPATPSMRANIEANTATRFAEIDTNHDGIVTRAEFDTFQAARRAAMGEQGPPPGGMRGGMGMGGMGPRWFERADADGDGKVTLAEAKTSALAMFDRLDANHDGRITPDEMPMRGGPARQ